MTFADAVIDQHFMLQNEVVERMVAEPGTKAFSRLSVMLQYRYVMEKMLDVPPESFQPPPKVDSAIVRMIPYEPHELPDVDPVLLGEIVTARSRSAARCCAIRSATIARRSISTRSASISHAVRRT